MSFKMLTGKKLDSMLDQLSAKDIKEIRAHFELDVQKKKIKKKDIDLYKCICGRFFRSLCLSF